MSFQEKSAWGLLAGLSIVSFFYFPAAFSAAKAVPSSVPIIAISIVGVIALVIIEVIYHTLIAAWSPKEAGVTDERDKLIDLKSERNAGLVLGIGLFTLVGNIVVAGAFPQAPAMAPMTIAIYILLAITVSEVAKLLSQIVYYRLEA